MVSYIKQNYMLKSPTYSTHCTQYYSLLVGGLELFYFSQSAGNFMIPTDELIFFRGLGIPPTALSYYCLHIFGYFFRDL